MLDVKAMGAEIVKTVREFVGRSLAPIIARLESLESRPAPKEVDLDAVRALIAEGIEQKLAFIVIPKGVEPDAVRAMVEEAIAAQPKPKDGEPGKSIEPDDVKDMVDAEVERAVRALPRPKDADPAAIKAEIVGELGPEITRLVDAIQRPKDGEPGKSPAAEDVAEAMTGHFHKWALEFERRATDILQRAVDKMPIPKDGVDALNIEDIDITHDGDGNVTFAFKRGELSKQFTIRLPRFKDCGVYRDGVDHREGDGVTWGGSLWLATKDGQLTKPGTPDSGWRLAVKAGRDGKSADVEPAPRVAVKLR